MGLHTGDVESTGPTWSASPSTARRASPRRARRPGALSDATRALVADTLPAGLGLRDLGEHRLKDLRAPERLTQLVIEGLPAIPAAASLDARPNNLPTQLTTFVGRERELGEAGALLGGTRLVSLTGPGGTGKTRLSLQVAAAAADDFPDGIWFVALEPVRVPELVQPTIARVLGVADSRNRPAIDTLADHIGGKPGAAGPRQLRAGRGGRPVIADLLRRCPRLAVPRHDAHHPARVGEQEYPVPGLPAPPDTSRLSEVDRLNLPRALREYDLDTLNQFEAVRLFIAPRNRGPARTSPSRTRTRRPLPGSRRACTGCPSRSSWRRRASSS